MVEAQKAGADYVLDTADLAQIQKLQFDKCISHVKMMPAVAGVARWLGPRGLMPSVKRGTVVEKVSEAVRAARGSVTVKGDKKNVVHVSVGMLGLKDAEIAENIKEMLAFIKKEEKIMSVWVAGTRGPGLLLNDY